MHAQLVLVSAVVAGVTAFSDPAGYEWKPPGYGDRRSPCPMLNTLANHGYLPRDGFNVSSDEFIVGLQTALNLAPDATAVVLRVALMASTTGYNNTVHLDDLNKHGVIEHDASLSRQDTALGNNHDFNPAIFASWFAAFADTPTIDLTKAAQARNRRIAAAKLANPAIQFGDIENRNSALETGQWARIFGGAELLAPREMVAYFFNKERLPFELGWTRSEAVITLQEALGLAAQIMAITGTGE